MSAKCAHTSETLDEGIYLRVIIPEGIYARCSPLNQSHPNGLSPSNWMVTIPLIFYILIHLPLVETPTSQAMQFMSLAWAPRP